MSILLYGATGYVGGLIVDEARRRGVELTLAARSQSVLAMAQAAGLACRVGGVDDIDLAGHSVVLNAAGPFQATAAGLAKRCVDSGVHYLDIAGEVAEYRAVHAFAGAAEQTGVMLMPGVGFGVVHTDCIARHLHERLPAATSLDIAFATDGGVSAGTLGSMAAAFGDRGDVSGAELRTRTVSFPSGDKRCVENPWRGDRFTAQHSTTIDEITTWIKVPRPVEYMMLSAHRRGDPDRPPITTRILRTIARRLPAGPSERQRARGSAEVSASATDGDGTTVSSSLTLPDAYVATVDSALEIALRVAGGEWTPGFRTPAQEYGADFVLTLPGVSRSDHD